MYIMTATWTNGEAPEENKLEELCGPLFDLFLRFERAFTRLALDRYDVTDADAEAFAVIMSASGADTGAAFAYLMRQIKTERVLRRVAFEAQAVFESRRSTGLKEELVSLNDLSEEFRKLQGGST